MISNGIGFLVIIIAVLGWVKALGRMGGVKLRGGGG